MINICWASGELGHFPVHLEIVRNAWNSLWLSERPLDTFFFQVALLSCCSVPRSSQITWSVGNSAVFHVERAANEADGACPSPKGVPSRETLAEAVIWWHKLVPCHSPSWRVAPEVLGCQLLEEIGRICTFLIFISFYVSVGSQVKQLCNSMPFSSSFQCCRIWVLFLSDGVWEANDCTVIRDPIWLHLDSLEDVINSRARIKMYISNCTSSKTWLGRCSVLGFKLRLSAYCNLSICSVCVCMCHPVLPPHSLKFF